MATPFSSPSLQPTSCSNSLRFSVLLATYNGEAYLAEQLQSIEKQTYPVHQLLVCDDASTDATLTIIEQFKRTTHIPVELICNPMNMGFARNFMQGIKACTGDYIAFCDQDDVWLPFKLERIVNAIEQHQAHTKSRPKMVFSDTSLVDSNLMPTGQTGFQYLKLTQQDMQLIHAGQLLKVLVRKPCVTGMTMVCERAALQALPSVDITSDIPHDYLISTAMAAHYPYVLVTEPLVLYRQHARNVIGMKNIVHKKKKKTIAQYLDEIFNDLIFKKQLFQYALKVQSSTENTDDFKKILNFLICFVNQRVQRRQSFKALLMPIASNTKRFYSLKERRRMFLKDFRSLLRVKLYKRNKR